MLQVGHITNDLMSSNCFILYEEGRNNCIVIDPASEKCEKLIAFLTSKKLTPDYVILTHEHTDHTWGCNTLVEKYDAKIICSQACKDALPKEGRAYFQLYYDNPDYSYSVSRVDSVVEELNNQLVWNGYKVHFYHTPGHSAGSICIHIDAKLFTGDTIMPYKPFIPKKRGSLEQFKKSISFILSSFSMETIVFPGHGDNFLLQEYIE